jgi:hypothetical protein
VGRFKVDLKREPNALVGYLLAALELLTGSVHLNERVGGLYTRRFRCTNWLSTFKRASCPKSSHLEPRFLYCLQEEVTR